MPAFAKNLIVFLTGGVIYSLIEILFRGFTHWTMTLTGGLCLLILFTVFSEKKMSLPAKCLFGAFVITSLEFAVGCLVNIILGWDVWDYSHCPYNLWGQICLPFSAAWFLITIPVDFLCRGLNRAFGGTGSSYSLSENSLL